MNPEKKTTLAEGGEPLTTAAATTTTTATSSSHDEAPTTVVTAAPASGSAHASLRRTPEMRRSAVRSLIQRYFYQLQNGCGNPECENINCASSGKVNAMSPNDMAAKAIQLFSQDAQLCETSQDGATGDVAGGSPSTAPSVSAVASKVPRTESTVLLHDSPTTSSTSLSQQDIDMVSPVESSSSSNSTITTSSSSSSSTSTPSVQSPNMRAPLLELIAVGSILPTKNGISNTSIGSGASTPTFARLEILSEETLNELVQECKQQGRYAHLVHTINKIFSNIECLSKNFVYKPVIAAEQSSNATSSTKLHELLAKSPCEFKKEDLRTLEGENDKDEDSTQQQQMDEQRSVAALDEMEAQRGETQLRNIDEDEPMDAEEACTSSKGATMAIDGVDATSSETKVDLAMLRRMKKIIFGLHNSEVTEGLIGGVIFLSDSIKYGRIFDWEQVLHCLVVCFDIATIPSNTPTDSEYLERALPKLCHAAAVLPVNAQARLARIWAANCSDQLRSLLQSCQQIITLQVILDEENVRENADIIAVTKVLKIVFYANVLAGHLETPSSLVPMCSSMSKSNPFDDMGTEQSSSGNASKDDDDDDDLFYYSGMSRPHMPKFAEDKLEQALHVSSIDSRVPLVPFEDFYNEPLSDTIQMHHDYLSYKNLSLERDTMGDDTYFTFMLYAFILTPATKVIALYYDSRMRMYSERNSTLYSILNSFGGEGGDITSRPDLKLTVRRDNLIDDALVGLELVAMSNPKDLKKQLVVEFMGEQGIDEGGVSKEFFQLIVDEIFNPDFGMFVHQEETNTMWFNSTPFENGAQFTLIGIILGLAIYNNVILAVNFPMVVYRKLMGCRGTFFDLQDWNPTLYRSLKSMLDYKEPDMEEVFMQTFKISYTDIFGEMVEHELVPNGGDIAVGHHNKQEFVNVYSDYLLNQSIEQQFKAFKKGFEMVTDESPLKLLFRPEEIEMLVCGSRKFDFVELEKSTEYEGGYTAETQIIKDFWSVVHSMPDESKRKLLEFTTGSDRIPVGGLSRLRLLITRHGPDSDRLPTSHTCFNVLLLPEYSSREKLEERLLKAINYSKGFGML